MFRFALIEKTSFSLKENIDKKQMKKIDRYNNFILNFIILRYI